MFASAAAFDPDSIDDVHVTISKSTGPTLFAASLTSASAFWSQPNAAVKKWIYKDIAATVGVKKALLKESPPGSGTYLFKMTGMSASIAGPLAPRTGHGPDPRDRAGGRHAPLLRRAPPHLHEQRDEGPLRAVMHRGPGWCESPPESPHVLRRFSRFHCGFD